MGNKLCLGDRERSLQSEKDACSDLPVVTTAPIAIPDTYAIETGIAQDVFDNESLTLGAGPEDFLLTNAQTGAANGVSQQLLATTSILNSWAGLVPEEIILQEPKELVEDVQILCAIGSGAFATVYRGVYQGADVAIKLVVSDAEKMAWGEAQLASQLRHPHVIQTYATRAALLTEPFLEEIYQFSGKQVAPARPTDLLPNFPSGDGLGDPRKASHEFQGWKEVLHRCGAIPNKSLLMLVQELCDQGTLSRAIRSGLFKGRKGVRTELVARRMLLRTAAEVCKGMMHLHKASVLHGDLKPANVLLSQSRADQRGFVAKVADFGLARQLQPDASRVESYTLGTVAYTSPEAFKGEHTKAGDVYAFGIMLWEMFTGLRPYEGMFVGRIMMGVGYENLRPKWPEADWPELCELGKKCLAHDPGARPSFKQLEKDLVKMEVDLRAESRRQSFEIAQRETVTQFSLPLQSLQEAQPGPQALQQHVKRRSMQVALPPQQVLHEEHQPPQAHRHLQPPQQAQLRPTGADMIDSRDAEPAARAISPFHPSTPREDRAGGTPPPLSPFATASTTSTATGTEHNHGCVRNDTTAGGRATGSMAAGATALCLTATSAAAAATSAPHSTSATGLMAGGSGQGQVDWGRQQAAPPPDDTSLVSPWTALEAPRLGSPFATQGCLAER